MTDLPAVTRNNGIEMPPLGFGVFQVDPVETERVVADALDVGDRGIDTASAYGSEEGVGRAISGSGVDREASFVTTKVRSADQGFDSRLPAFACSPEELGRSPDDVRAIVQMEDGLRVGSIHPDMVNV